MTDRPRPRLRYSSCCRVLALALLVAVTSSCGLFQGTLPPRELYRLSDPDTSSLVIPLAATRDGAPVAGPLDGALAIAAYRTPGIYGGQSIVYRIGENQYGSYGSREWAMPLTMMLGSITERVLATNPISQQPAVYDPPTRLVHPFTWQGTVREFEEVNRERSVFVSVVLDVRIVRSLDQAVIWSGTAAVEHPVPDPTMLAIVQALSDAAAEAVTRLASAARDSLERSPPTASR